MNDDLEIELKLAIDPGDVMAFRQLPVLKDQCLDGPTRRKVFNAYFDTPDLLLEHNAMALRLRKTGGKWLQTLKTAGTAAGGLHQRGEWEFPLREPQLDLALFRETPLAALRGSRELHLALRSVFVAEFNRTAWQVQVAPGQRVEVALDQGVIRSGPNESAVCEVEIEAIEGGAAAVFEMALALTAQMALRPEILSKAERGYRLFQPASPVARRAGAIELKRKWNLHQARQETIAACLQHYLTNVEGALNNDAPEYVHQLRVALRRLRSALRVFKPAGVEALTVELKWLANALGDAREWDVLLADNLPALLDNDADPATCTSLMAAARQRQAEARASARAAIASPRATRLVLTIARWNMVSGEPAPSLPRELRVGEPDSEGAFELTQFAARIISRRHKRLLRDAETLRELSAEARHRVRIDAKRLRYAVEFFAGLFSRKPVEQYVKTLSQIQDALGEANDNAIAFSRLASLAPSERFMDFARGWYAAGTQAKLDGVDRCIADLNDAKCFWKG